MIGLLIFVSTMIGTLTLILILLEFFALMAAYGTGCLNLSGCNLD
jgi:hypothetical protein